MVYFFKDSMSDEGDWSHRRFPPLMQETALTGRTEVMTGCEEKGASTLCGEPPGASASDVI